MYWSLGSNIMEPIISLSSKIDLYIQRYSNFKQTTAKLKSEFEFPSPLQQPLSSIHPNEFSIQRFEGLQYIGAQAPFYWSLRKFAKNFMSLLIFETNIIFKLSLEILGTNIMSLP